LTFNLNFILSFFFVVEGKNAHPEQMRRQPGFPGDITEPFNKDCVPIMALMRENIQLELMRIFEENFEIENPGPDDDLREKYEFDSIDAIELLVEIESLLGFKLTQEEKKQAMGIRTINHIYDYMEAMEKSRN